MAWTYLIVLDPSSNDRPEVRFYNPTGNRTLPGFYVGYTGKTPSERFEEHLMRKPLVRDHNPQLMIGFSTLFGDMDQATARTAEAFLADFVRRLKYCCTSDATLENARHPAFGMGSSGVIDLAIAVKDEACHDAWNNSVFTLAQGRLHLGAGTNGPTCTTQKQDELEEIVSSIGYAYGQKTPNGRFALNGRGQVIRKLMPPAKVDRKSVFVVGVKAPEIVQYTEEIELNGKPVRLVGEEISLADAFTDLPLVSTSQFQSLESALSRMIGEAVRSYSSAA